MQTIGVKIGAIISVSMLMGGILTGCLAPGGPSTSATEAQQENRTYMAQVNQEMEDLNSGLEGFTDAVSRNDVVGMRTQANNAYVALDALEGLEAPEVLADVQSQYVSGATTLRSALDAYIELYTEIDAARGDDSFDWSTYDQRLADIQSQYDEGVAALESADEAAATME